MIMVREAHSSSPVSCTLEGYALLANGWRLWATPSTDGTTVRDVYATQQQQWQPAVALGQVWRGVPVGTDAHAASWHPEDVCPETGQETCSRCAGSFCETHGSTPCPCDMVERHQRDAE